MRPVAVGELETPHDQQPSQVVLLVPHPDRTKQGRRCNHATRSLVDLGCWLQVQPAGLASAIFHWTFLSQNLDLFLSLVMVSLVF